MPAQVPTERCAADVLSGAVYYCRAGRAQEAIAGERITELFPVPYAIVHSCDHEWTEAHF